MKKWMGLALCLLFLCGCALEREDRAMSLRSKLLKAEKVNFSSHIIADYGDKLYEFTMDCTGLSSGDLDFTVSEPESISGISGHIRSGRGGLQFDSEVLAFPLIADDLMSPVGAPWVIYEALRSGYITAQGADGENYLLTISYPYGDENLTVDVHLDGDDIPTRGEILSDGRRYLTVEVKNFEMR